MIKNKLKEIRGKLNNDLYEIGNKPLAEQVFWSVDSSRLNAQVDLLNQLIITPDFDGLDFPDIRNKLTPVTTLISLFERGGYEYMKELLPQVKESINYLVGREVYEK